MLTPPRDYVILDAVARAGSIRKAADGLHIASTALNRRIHEIEDRLGTPLFERLPRGVRLTAAGEVLVATARRGLSDIKAATSQIEQLRGLMRGTVRLGCAESVASDLVPRCIALYHARHPGVQFQVVTQVTASLVSQLLRDEVDLILAHGPPPTDDLRVLRAVVQPLCAMMHPDHPLAQHSSVRLIDCQPFPLALGDSSFSTRRLIDTLATRLRIRLQVALESSTVQSIKEFSRHSRAISFQYQIGTQREVRSGDLVAVPLSDKSLNQGQLVLACRASRVLPIASQSFAQTLEQALDHALDPLPEAGD